MRIESITTKVRKASHGPFLVALLGAVTWAPGLGAQVATKHGLTLEGAKRVAGAAAAEATRTRVGGAIAVVDEGGNVLYVERLDGTFPAASDVAIAKARTAARFRRPTKVFEDAIRGGRTSLVAVSVMTPLEGGQPILVDGEVVGGVGVSGAASSAQDDEIAIVAAGALSRTSSHDDDAGRPD
jgi:glc operon protein GlcG